MRQLTILVLLQAAIASIIPGINYYLLSFVGLSQQISFFEKKLFLDAVAAIICINIIVIPTICIRQKLFLLRNKILRCYIYVYLPILIIISCFIVAVNATTEIFDVFYLVGMFISHMTAGIVLAIKGMTFRHIFITSSSTLFLIPFIFTTPQHLWFGLSGIFCLILHGSWLFYRVMWKRRFILHRDINILILSKLNFFPWLYNALPLLIVYLTYDFFQSQQNIELNSKLSWYIMAQTLISYPAVALSPKIFREFSRKQTRIEIPNFAILIVYFGSVWYGGMLIFVLSTFLLVTAKLEMARSLGSENYRGNYILTRVLSFIIIFVLFYNIYPSENLMQYFLFLASFELTHRILWKFTQQ